MGDRDFENIKSEFGKNKIEKMEKNYTEALLEPVKMEKRGFGSLDFSQMLLLSSVVFAIALVLAFILVFIISVRYRRALQAAEVPELEGLIEQKAETNRYTAPENVYISEVRKMYNTNRNNETIYQTLPEQSADRSSGSGNSGSGTSDKSDLNETGYQSDSIFSTFEKKPNSVSPV